MTQYSQRDTRWSSNKLGYGQTTIHSFGCTITALAQLLTLNGHTETPETVNNKLKANSGFVGSNKNLLVWGAIQNAFSFAKHISRVHTYNNNAVADAIKKYGGCLVEVNGSRIGASRHWVLYIGGGEMIDPWTGTKRPTSFYPATGYSTIAVTKAKDTDMSNTYTQEQWQVERDERNKNWDLYQAQLRENERLETQIVSLKKEIKDLNDKLKIEYQLNADYRDDIIALQEEINQLSKTPAVKIDKEVEVAGSIWEINGVQVDSDGKITANYAKK